MDLEARIKAFEALGNYIAANDTNGLQSAIMQAQNENSWFTPESIHLALISVRKHLEQENLVNWLSKYNLTNVMPKRVAVVAAGNIPLVGFHDFLCVLISGHTLQIKLSSKDSVLLKHLSDVLINLEPRFSDRITFADQIKNFDAVIATGSDNSSRYFQYYFGKYPHIIRKNRTSSAILTGKETADELQALGKDVFSYFGLGCRNVSKLYVPSDYDITKLLDHWSVYKDVLLHHKYNNNYDYQKSILLINKDAFFDSGFVMLQESMRLVSPISVVYYERYKDEGDLALKLTSVKEKIQCVVGNQKPATVPFGQAQSPQLWDYADQIDTLKFLEHL